MEKDGHAHFDRIGDLVVGVYLSIFLRLRRDGRGLLVLLEKPCLHLDPTTAFLANFEPLTAVVLGVLLLNLTLNTAELVGIALLAVMVVRLTRAKRK